MWRELTPAQRKEAKKAFRFAAKHGVAVDVWRSLSAAERQDLKKTLKESLAARRLGVDPEVWTLMTKEEKRAFRKNGREFALAEEEGIERVQWEAMTPQERKQVVKRVRARRTATRYRIGPEVWAQMSKEEQRSVKQSFKNARAEKKLFAKAQKLGCTVDELRTKSKEEIRILEVAKREAWKSHLKAERIRAREQDDEEARKPLPFGKCRTAARSILWPTHNRVVDVVIIVDVYNVTSCDRNIRRIVKRSRSRAAAALGSVLQQFA